MKTPQVVNREGIGTLFMLVGQHVALAAAAGDGRLLRRRPARRRRPGRPEADAGRDQARLQEAQPGLGLKNLFNPQHFAVESVKNVVKTAAVGAIAAHGRLPQARRAGRAGGHAAASI